MLGLFLVFLLSLNISESLVRDPQNMTVGGRQFYSNRNNWHYMLYKKILYTMSDELDDLEKKYIRDQFEKLTNKTCLRSFEYAPNDEDCTQENGCIHFYRRAEPSPCFGDKDLKTIHLPPHCFSEGWVLHEIMHVLGFGNMHQREDRDCYVQLVDRALIDDINYKKDVSNPPTIDLTFPYDVHSIMHYRKGALRPAEFAYNQLEDFGGFDELTEMDVIALNYMFCGGPHYCDTNPVRCQYFRCWVECNPCSTQNVTQCTNCTGNTY